MPGGRELLANRLELALQAGRQGLDASSSPCRPVVQAWEVVSPRGPPRARPEAGRRGRDVSSSSRAASRSCLVRPGRGARRRARGERLGGERGFGSAARPPAGDRARARRPGFRRARPSASRAASASAWRARPRRRALRRRPRGDPPPSRAPRLGRSTGRHHPLPVARCRRVTHVGERRLGLRQRRTKPSAPPRTARARPLGPKLQLKLVDARAASGETRLAASASLRSASAAGPRLPRRALGGGRTLVRLAGRRRASGPASIATADRRRTRAGRREQDDGDDERDRGRDLDRPPEPAASDASAP
jgi:hypothetical protein